MKLILELSFAGCEATRRNQFNVLGDETNGWKLNNWCLKLEVFNDIVYVLKVMTVINF